jgi:hypothetical protein
MDLSVKQSVGHARNRSKQLRPGRAERRVQEAARRRASRQLLRVSSDRFSQARQEYLDWEALSLWVRAIVDAEGRVPAQVSRNVQERCPGFLKYETQYRETHPKRASPLPLLLLEWIHEQVFAYAKQEGWLDALIFFSVRDPYSERTWAYWEHCKDEWSRRRPASYPSFDEWRLTAESWKGRV